MTDQEEARNAETDQGHIYEKDLEKLAPLNVDKPSEKKDGVQSVGHKPNTEILKEVCPSIRDYISIYITLADVKAGILIGIFSGLLSFSISRVLKISGNEIQQWRLFDYVGCLSWIAYAISITCALIVVWPNTLTSKKRGFVSWVHISNYSNVEDYLKDFLSANEGQITTQMCEINYDLSSVCKRKYLWLSRSFKAGVFGTLILAIILIRGYF